MAEKEWTVYLLRCSDNSLYCGITNDLENRLAEHNSGKGAKYTRSRKPVELVGVSPAMTKSEALKFEYRIKRLPANRKISGLRRKEKPMAILKKDLTALQKEIKALGKKMEKLIAEAGKSAKPKAAKKAAAKKAPAKKGAKKLSATDQVLAIINRSKSGVNIKTLMDKTGFNQKKVTNILQRTHKAGKIKRVRKGVYIGA
jgi:putative endonuclease